MLYKDIVTNRKTLVMRLKTVISKMSKDRKLLNTNLKMNFNLCKVLNFSNLSSLDCSITILLEDRTVKPRMKPNSSHLLVHKKSDLK